MNYKVGDKLFFVWKEQEKESYTPGTIAHILNNGKILVHWDDKTSTLTTEAFLKKATKQGVRL